MGPLQPHQVEAMATLMADLNIVREPVDARWDVGDSWLTSRTASPLVEGQTGLKPVIVGAKPFTIHPAPAPLPVERMVYEDGEVFFRKEL